MSAFRSVQRIAYTVASVSFLLASCGPAVQTANPDQEQEEGPAEADKKLVEAQEHRDKAQEADRQGKHVETIKEVIAERKAQADSLEAAEKAAAADKKPGPTPTPPQN